MKYATLLSLLLGMSPAYAAPGTAVWRVPMRSAPALAIPGAGVAAVTGSGAVAGLSGTVYLPTDNLDPRGCAMAGVMMPDGTVATAGQVIRVKMTVAGGQPANGATVWLAGNEDDGAGWEQKGVPNALYARGKFTATLPNVTTNATDLYPLMRQNLAVGGVVVDNSSYGVDQTVTVRLTPQSHCDYTSGTGVATDLPDTTQTFRGAKLPLSPASAFTADGTVSQMKLNDNETLIITFVVDNVRTVSDVHDSGWRNYGIGSGWFIDINDSCRTVSFFSDTGGTRHTPSFIGDPAPGKNMLIVSRYGGNYHVNLNGSRGDGVVTDVGADAVTGQVFAVDFAFGVTTALVKLHRAMDDTEMQLIGGGNSGVAVPQYYSQGFGEGLNPYGPDATMLSDPELQWYVDFGGYTGGTLHAIGGPAGSSFDFATSGTPIVRTMTYTWTGNVAPYLQDGDVQAYDSRHSIRHSPMQRVRISTQNQYEWAMASWGVVAEDQDNNDEGEGPTTFVTSGAASWQLIGGSGVAPWTPYLPLYRNPVWSQFRTQGRGWWTAAGAPPYTYDMVVSDSLLRETTFVSGQYLNRLGLLTTVEETGSAPRATSIVDIDFSTASRLTIVSSGLMSGHLNDFLSGSPLSGAPCTRMRAAYPGKITCDATGFTSLTGLLAWGAGSMEAYARKVIDMSLQGNPSARKVVFVDLGASDWASALEFPAPTAAKLVSLLQWTHAVDPQLPLYVVVPFCPSGLSVDQGKGTLQAFVDAMTSALASLSYVTRLDVSGPNALTWNGCGVAIGSQQALADNFQTALGY